MSLTLETAKQLKESGWSKETENNYWSKNSYCPNHPRGQGCLSCEDTDLIFLEWLVSGEELESNSRHVYIKAYPCPSIEELLAEMPIGINLNGVDYMFMLSIYPFKGKRKYCVVYEDCDEDSNPDVLASFLDTDPAEAVAQLWIKLKQEGLC